MKNNLILMTDSYKASHWKQYPPNANGYFGYIEARGTNEPGVEETVFFGLQMFIKKYLLTPFTAGDIIEAESFFSAHGEPFNGDGWRYIFRKYGGYIPVKIKAVREGTIVPLRNVLVTVECTDPECFWVGSYIETMLMRAVWYPTTVATNSFECKKVIMKYLQATADNPDAEINFKLHDFGGRGVSSSESAEIGGASHLVNFMGSDTVEGVRAMNMYYNAGNMSGFSIPAAEHSTITAWGRDHEVDAYKNMLTQYAKPGSLVAVVSDSYDIYHAVSEIWGKILKQDVIDSGATIVIRPDSGNPAYVVLKVCESLASRFGFTVNKKGYKVLNNVRVIQGDGINKSSIGEILQTLKEKKFSASNVAFGMGGALLQQLNRDTFQFAMKCSAIRVGTEWKNVSKAPVTDEKKRSKAGRVTLWRDREGYIFTQVENTGKYVAHATEILETVYVNGKLMRDQDLDDVRARAEL